MREELLRMIEGQEAARREARDAERRHNRAIITELGDVLMLVESFLDGWHMPDAECQQEADSLLVVVKEAMRKIEQ